MLSYKLNVISSLSRNPASKRKDSNRATSPRHLSAVLSDRHVSSAVESCDRVTVIVIGWSRGQVTCSCLTSRFIGVVTWTGCLASRFIGEISFFNTGKKNGGVAVQNSNTVALYIRVSFWTKDSKRHIAITSQHTCCTSHSPPAAGTYGLTWLYILL